MKKLNKILFIFLSILLLISSCAKYELSDEAYVIKYGDVRTNSVLYEDNIYYEYKGKLLISGNSKDAKITIYNIYYDVYGNIERIVPKQTMLLKSTKVYAISLINGISNTTVGKEIVEYISMKEVIYIAPNNEILIEEK